MRRQRRAAARLLNLLLFIVIGLTSLPLSAMIYMVHADYSWLQRQVDAKESQLNAFESQYEVGQRRLAALKSEKGREEILIEHGYVPPGDRILLFPATPEEQRAASIPANDLAPHPPLISATPPSSSEPSVWRRTTGVLRRWWSSLRAGAGIKDSAGVKDNGAKAPAAPNVSEQSGSTDSVGSDAPPSGSRAGNSSVANETVRGEPMPDTTTDQQAVANEDGETDDNEVATSGAVTQSEDAESIHANPTVAPANSSGSSLSVEDDSAAAAAHP